MIDTTNTIYPTFISLMKRANQNKNIINSKLTTKKQSISSAELEKEQRRSPKHQFNIQSRLNLTNRWELDNILYYVDGITVTNYDATSLKIPSYFRFDSRIGFKYSQNIYLDLIGQNLFDESHIEFSGPMWNPPIEVGRTIYGKVTLKF